MTVQVVACVTINQDEPEALEEYLRVTTPLLEEVGARIMKQLEIGDAVIGEPVAKKPDDCRVPEPRCSRQGLPEQPLQVHRTGKGQGLQPVQREHPERMSCIAVLQPLNRVVKKTTPGQPAAHCTRHTATRHSDQISPTGRADASAPRPRN